MADDARSAVLGYYSILNRPNSGPTRLKLRGLDPATSYRVSIWTAAVGDENDESPSPIVLGGDVLLAAGLVIEGLRLSSTQGDFRARVYVLESI